MKGIYLISAIAAVFLASSSVITAEEKEFNKIPTKCPDKDPKNTMIHLPHESDCTKFYMCQAGKKILRQCPYMNNKVDRSHFNPRLEVCDWPYRAGCKKKNFDQDEDKILNVQFIEKKEHHGPWEDGSRKCHVLIPKKCPAKDPKNTTIHLAHENDCTKFYMCQLGKKILRICPYMNKHDRLHFNPCLQVCEWPWDAGCKHKNSDKKQAVALNEESIAKKHHSRVARAAYNKCPDKNPGNTTIHLPHEYDCTKFYICLGLEKIEEDCPYMNKDGDRLHFNRRSQVCDWPDTAGCDDKDFDDDQEVEVTTKHSIPDEEEDWSWEDGSRKCHVQIPKKCPAKDPKNTTIHLAHEYDCTKFYMCQLGKKIERICPYMNKYNRLHFNPCLQVCDWPDQAGCRSRGSTYSTRHTDHTKSTRSTWRTRPTSSTRPTWSTRSTRSTWRTRPTSSTRPTWSTRSTRSTWYTHHTDHTTEPTWPTRPPGDECTWDNDGLLLPHECNCNMYYKCVKGNKILWQCPKGLYFSKKHQGCVKYEDSDCKKEISKCTREGELIPYECDCTKYYKCRKYDQVLRKCGKGLHFSPKRRKCEHPDKAGCDRESPGDCPENGSKYPWRHECDCRLFYKCENGKKRLYECPWGYYYDVKKDKCVLQKFVTDCKNR